MNKIRIRTTSRRSLDDACERARVPFPSTVQDFGPTYLRLLVEGVDFDYVGRVAWIETILRDAPREPRPEAKP